MNTVNVVIGAHNIVLKEELQRKDLVLLAKLKKMRDEVSDDTEFKEMLESDLERLFEFTNILVQIFVVSINGETDKNKILKLFDEMSIENSNNLTLEVTNRMQNFEKKKGDLIYEYECFLGRDGGNLSEEWIEVMVCEKMGWTHEEYMNEPAWKIELILAKNNLEAKSKK